MQEKLRKYCMNNTILRPGPVWITGLSVAGKTTLGQRLFTKQSLGRFEKAPDPRLDSGSLFQLRLSNN